jgi:hypothetical protein
MKNIFLLPTDKPSRLMIDTIENKLYLQPILHEKTINVLPQHIYITSDEVIKDVRPYKGNWQLEQGEILNKFPTYLTDLSECKLVIMTTDTDLIADGVQAIDDEFLEWFVNNPTCEEVKTRKIGNEWIYNADVPQEEIKQCECGSNCVNTTNKDKPFCFHCGKYLAQQEPKREDWEFEISSGCNGYRNEITGEWIYESEYIQLFNKPKQETLKEAAANLADPNICKTDNWIAGAKYMTEKMYSEEEVKFIISEALQSALVKVDLEQWFKQFKKK